MGEARGEQGTGAGSVSVYQPHRINNLGLGWAVVFGGGGGGGEGIEGVGERGDIGGRRRQRPAYLYHYTGHQPTQPTANHQPHPRRGGGQVSDRDQRADAVRHAPQGVVRESRPARQVGCCHGIYIFIEDFKADLPVKWVVGCMWGGLWGERDQCLR
jgi:hypothetical protein